MNTFTRSTKEAGAALVVGLVLLVFVTVLAISGMNTATTELAIARNDQNYENAFQAAETGLAIALSQGYFVTVPETELTQDDSYDENNYSVDTIIRFETTTLVPDKAFSLGVDSGVAAYHFVAEATAESTRIAEDESENNRDASARHTQAFYIVGPEASSL